MKDKEMIEEITEQICNNCKSRRDGVCFCIKPPCPDVIADSKMLYNAGYRKIDNNSVVLTREELNDIENKSFDIGFDKGAEIGRANAPKETAEKILEHILRFANEKGVVEIPMANIKSLAILYGIEIKE